MPDQNDPNARPDPNAGDDGHEDVAQPEIKLIKVQQVDPKTGKPLNPGDPAQEIDPTGLTDGEISAEKTTLADVVLSTDRFGNMKTPRRRTSRGKNPQGQHFKDERRIKHPLPAIAVKHSANHGAKVLVTAGVLLLAGLLYGQIQKGNSLTEQLTASVNDAKAKATALEAANKATESAQAEAAEAKKQAEAAATPKPLQIVTQKALAARGNLHPPIVTLDKTQVLTDADFPSGSNLGDYFDLGGVTWNSDLAIAVVQYQRRPAYSQLPAALQAKEPGRLVLRKVEVNDGLTTPYRLSGLKMIRDIDGVTAFSVVLEHKSTALVDDDHFQAMGERRLGLLETQPTALADSNVN